MTSASATRIIAALTAADVDITVGGGWAIDALVGRETRPHGDLDLWLPAEHLEALIEVVADLGVDRLLPWGGDRPWVLVLHDGHRLRIDLHMYEPLGDGFVHYGSVLGGHRIAADALHGTGHIAGMAVTCDTAAWALRCKTGHAPREVDLLDVPLLCEKFGFALPQGFSAVTPAIAPD